VSAIRGRIAHITSTAPLTWEYYADGILVIEDGHITDLGPAERLFGDGLEPAACEQVHGLLLPGFVDTHVHSPQIDVIGSYGEQLLEWLERYTFPAEAAYVDEAYAAAAADVFLAALLQQGTTSASIYTTIHRQATDEVFAAANRRNMRLLAGKVLMDRNAPQNLSDTAVGGVEDSRKLIEKWHGTGRLGYAVTPRFAVTSTASQLQAAGELHRDYPDTWVQTHLSENHAEIAMVAKLFPEAEGYLDVYDRFGLLTDRAIFGHCLHLSRDEIARMADAGGKVAFCPSSNLFLGSGLIDLAGLEAAGIDVALASDVGGGTSLSMLRTMGDAYKVCRMAGQTLSPMYALALATLRAAEALHLEPYIGNFVTGKEADVICLNARPGSLLERRLAQIESIEEEIFLYMTMDDEACVTRTWVMGDIAWEAH